MNTPTGIPRIAPIRKPHATEPKSQPIRIPSTITAAVVNGVVQVTVNGVVDQIQPTTANVDRVVIYGSKANDNITIDPTLAAIATIDSALHLRLIDEDDLDEIFSHVSPRRRVLRRFVDGRAESGTETLVRLIALMLGFEVPWAGGEPRAQEEEIQDVRWFTRAEVAAAAELDVDGWGGAPEEVPGDGLLLPPRLAIARRLLERWLSGGD